MRKLYTCIIACVIALTSSASLAVKPASLLFDVEGINGDIKQNVVNKLSESAENSDFAAWYAHADANIKEAMAPYGYFSPAIQSKIKQQNGVKYVRFIITKNHPVIIRSIKVKIEGEGKKNSDIQNAVNATSLNQGAILRSEEYEKMKANVLKVANEQGFIKTYWEKSIIKIDPQQRTAEVQLILQTKKRYYFGKTIFHEKNNVYADSFLQRFSLSSPNGYFSSERLISYQQRLTSSQYFNEVNLIPDLNVDSNQIPVIANVEAPPAKKYMLGLGYSTWSGPRFLGGVILRHLNNVGHYIETQLKLSSVISAFSAKYYIPGRNPLTQQWIMGINAQRFLPKYGSSNSNTLLLGYNIKNEDWQTNLALNYLIEQYKIQGSNTQTSAFLYPSINVSHNQADDPIYPNYAHNISLMLRGSSKALSSSANFIQGLLSTKYLYSIVNGTRVITRVDVGYTVVQDVTNLPLSLRFFMGGANSIRGFKDSSIGPGKYLLLGSLELQQRIYENWEAAVFYDQGKATNHFNSPWNKSVGLGAIYTSIIGPVKLYVARDISLAKKPYRIEFSFGPEF